MKQGITQKDTVPSTAAPSSRSAESGRISIGQPLDVLLTSGGDPRLLVHPEDNMNSYGCRPSPRPEAISFSSTTASTISDPAYLHVSEARLDLIRANDGAAFEDRMEEMRAALKACLLPDGGAADVVFAPSGTDGQILALFMARAVLDAPVTSLIVGAGETGSGTAFTARGRHFSTRTAQGVAVEKDKDIAGLADGTTSVDIPLRDAAGAMRGAEEIDQAVLAAVEDVVARGGKVLLQTMDASKLGTRAPTTQCLRRIADKWPEDVLVVVDACQMRLGRKRIAAYLRRGYLVLLTGSKFFAGPPFSGAVLVPPALSARMKKVETLPAGLADYTNRSDWPAAWQTLRAALPARTNLGQWLRWEAALEEMRLYFDVPPQQRRAALEGFATAVTHAIEKAPSLTMLSAPPADATDDIDDAEMATRTVFPFFVWRDGKKLAAAECRKIYQALNHDVSALLPETAADVEKKLAAHLCHIGQPVALGDAAVLRVAAGARNVYDGWTEEQVRTVFDKIELLVKYPALLAAPEKTDATEAATAPALRLARKGDVRGQARIGMAKLTRMAFNNVPLKPLWDELYQAVEKNPADAAAMMDMADIAQISGLQANGLVVQSGALGMERLYHLPCAAEMPRLRLLMLAAPVEMGCNTPIEFLLEGSDVALSALYIVPGLPLPDPLPYHDVVFNAITDTENARPSLKIAEQLMPRWPRPFLNSPDGIRRLKRDALHALLADVAEISIPMTARLSRADLQGIGTGTVEMTDILADGIWPLIVRPIDSYAGRGLDKLETAADIERYLARTDSPEIQAADAFFISRYIDYSGADGAFRKYRIVFIDGKAYAIHMAISHQWKIWYLNADMAESAEKRAEEDDFMTHFEDKFAAKHKTALAEIAARVDLAYFAIDCAETRDGKLLIFEGGNDMIIHNMDSAAVYPYKVPQMKKVYQAFVDMIGKYADCGDT